MSLSTFSKFYFGHSVSQENQFLSFSEGVPELIAEVNIGSYTMTDLMQSVASALSAEGAQQYTVTVNRDTRLVTIAAASNFSLKVATGSSAGQSIFSLLGFTGLDRTGSNSYTGNLPSGSEYRNQFILQSYTPPENYKQAVESTVNKTSSGRVELVKFGTERFFEFNMKYINNYQQEDTIIKNNASGVEDFIEFMDYITEKAVIEFMPDESDSDTFYNILLESTPESKDGTGYKLRENYDQGLPGYFESGLLKFRNIT